MTSDDSSRRAAVEALHSARNVVVFTGAGVSAESGIATFRDDEGFWRRFPPEQFASWTGLLRTAAREPRRLGEFLLALLEPIAEAVPNPGHQAIARLERFVPITVVTQNIDGLHQDAGSTRVLEVHGTLFEVVDARTGRLRRRISREQLRQMVSQVRSAMSAPLASMRLMAALQPLFGLDFRGGHRPRLVLFGDAMAEPAWSESRKAIGGCDVFLSVGTSGEVFPAALLPIDAQHAGATVITVDPAPSGLGIHLLGAAGDILPRLVDDAFGSLR
jgi:NAD-dependent deacetylase